MNPKVTFEQLLLDVINEEYSLLGENCKQSIFFQIEKNTGISKSEIPVRTKDFAEAIEKIVDFQG